jgi:choline-glycine betaine transporter
MNHDHSQAGMGKHMLLMLICCLVPIGLVAAVSVLGLSLGPLQALVPYVAALMCPLMMIGMMWMMLRDNKRGPSEQRSNAPESVAKLPEVPNNIVPKENCH